MTCGDGVEALAELCAELQLVDGTAGVELIVAADLDGDIDSELAYADGNLVVVLGVGTTGDVFIASLPAPVLALHAADLTGDGQRELLAGTADPDAQLVVITKESAGLVPSYRTLGVVPTTFAVAKLNEDALADLAVRDAVSGDVAVLLQAANGAFSPPMAYATSTIDVCTIWPIAAPAGAVDLMLVNNGDGRVLSGDGAGDFTLGGTLSAAARCGGGAAGDGEGFTYVVAAGLGPGAIVVIGPGFPGAEAQIGLEAPLEDATWGPPLEGGNAQQYAVLSGGALYLASMTGDGVGPVSAPAQIPGARRVVYADFNADQLLDFAVVGDEGVWIVARNP